MKLDVSRPDLVVGVIGTGAMGRGIAQLFASAGQQVWLYDSRPETIDQALQFNRELLERNVANGRLADVVLFGAFLAWAVADFIAARKRLQADIAVRRKFDRIARQIEGTRIA